MEIVRSGFHRVVKHSRAGLAEFRGIVAGLNRELLEGLDARLHLRLRERNDAVGHILTFHAHRLSIAGSAIDPDIQIRIEVRAGSKARHRHGVPHPVGARKSIADRQQPEIHKPVARNVDADVSALGLEKRSLCADGHGFCSRAYLQSRIDSSRLRRLHRDVLANEFLESGDRNREFVGADRHLSQRVVAGFAGCSLVSRPGLGVFHLDRSIRNHGSSWIGYSARNRAAVGLRKRSQRAQR